MSVESFTKPKALSPSSGFFLVFFGLSWRRSQPVDVPRKCQAHFHRAGSLKTYASIGCGLLGQDWIVAWIGRGSQRLSLKLLPGLA